MSALEQASNASANLLLVTLVNVIVVAVVVAIHYEFLSRLSASRASPHFHHRVGIVFGVFGALTAHAVEVWVFAFAYYLMHHSPGWGTLAGEFSGSLLDCAYFSFTTFTTVGFGDIHPVGAIRFLTGIEALTGLVLITWTASFLFLEMQRHWTVR